MGLLSSIGKGILGIGAGVANNAITSAQAWKYQQKQNEWNAQQQEKQNQFAEQQAATAYNRQVEFWNLQNSYNDPSKQIDRLRSAGINPSLTYANGGLNNIGASTPSVSQGSTASPVTGSFNSPINTGAGSQALSNIVALDQNKADLNVKKSEVDKNKAQEAAANATAAKANADAQAQNLENAINADKEIANARKKGFKGRYDSEAKAGLISDQQLQGLISDNTIKAYDTNLAKDTYDYKKQLMQSQAKSAQVEARNRQRMIDIQYKQMVADIRLKQKQGLLTAAQATAAYAQAEVFRQSAYYVGQQGDSMMFQNSFDFPTSLEGVARVKGKDGKYHYNARGAGKAVGSAVSFIKPFAALF